MSHNVVHSINEKLSDLLKNMHLRVKNRTPLAFWKLLIWTSCLSCLEIISNGP